MASLVVRPSFVPLESWDGSLLGHPSMGGEPPWWTHVPALHRVLANPSGGEWICSLPPLGSQHQDWLAYWFLALYLLVYSFGWLKPGRGVAWWFEEDRPTDDLRLELLRQIWDRDRRLDLLAAQLWTNPMADAMSEVAATCGVGPIATPDVPRPQPPQEFVARFPEVNSPSFSVYGGGTDPMPFGHHITAGVREAPADGWKFIASDSPART